MATSSVPCVCTFRSLLIDLVWLGIGTHGRVRSKGRWIVPSLFLHPSRGSYPSGLPSPCVSMRPTGRVRRSLHHATPSVDLPFRPCSTRLGCILPSIPSLRVSGVGVIEGMGGEWIHRSTGLSRVGSGSLPIKPPFHEPMEPGSRRKETRTTQDRRRTHEDGAAMRPASIARGNAAGRSSKGAWKKQTHRRGNVHQDGKRTGAPAAVPKVSTTGTHQRRKERGSPWKEHARADRKGSGGRPKSNNGPCVKSRRGMKGTHGTGRTTE